MWEVLLVPLPDLTVVERARLQVTVGAFGRDHLASAKKTHKQRRLSFVEVNKDSRRGRTGAGELSLPYGASMRALAPRSRVHSATSANRWDCEY